jgi:L-aspartate oxidase
VKQFDFVIVGSGVAGLSLALKLAPNGSVAVVTKRAPSESSTAWAQGGVACVTSVEDSFELHIEDTLVAGVGLCDETAVRTIVTDGPGAVGDLVRIGVHFDERMLEGGNRELDLGKEGGHSKRRVLHYHDSTGREIEQRLLSAVAKDSRVQLLDNHMAVDLITTGKLGYATENRAVGIYVLNEISGVVETLRSDRIILATGGCGKVYLYTTNPNVSTGDGVAMAWRAGAAIANMEFIQFHPTCLFHPIERTFLISEAVRGEGGRLVNEQGREFMGRYDSRGALAPRDIVARAIDAEMKRTGARCMFIDITHRPADFIRKRFPHIHETCAALGIDITKQPIPVVPAAHYQCGGVKTDLDGATTLRGLFAIGEVASTGLHGANRLASNSLLEGIVLARRCAEALLRPKYANYQQDLALPDWRPGHAQDVDEMVVVYHNWEEIRRLMWDYVGIVRTDKRLQRASARLRNLHREIQEFYWDFKLSTDLLELRNLCTVASLIVDSALARKESRGLHYTLDFPARDDEKFLRETVLARYDAPARGW